MKKRILAITATLMLFAGVATASSINGDYKGNPIVKLKSNGMVIDTGDVPAMIYDGKTMVPIAALRNLGAGVSWDPNTYSVDVTIKHDNSSASSLAKAKYYSFAGNHYHSLISYADSMIDLTDTFSHDLNAITSGTAKNAQISFNSYNSLVNTYKSISDSSASVATESGKYNDDVSDINSIMKDITDTMKTYQAALKALDDFSVLKRESDIDTYSNKMTDALNRSYDIKEKVTKRYYDYLTLIQNL